MLFKRSDTIFPTKSSGHHRRLRRLVARFFPELKEHEVSHLANLINNEICKFKTEVHFVDFQTHSFKDDGWYVKSLQVTKEKRWNFAYFVIEHQFNRRHWSRLFLGPKTYVIYARATID